MCRVFSLNLFVYILFILHSPHLLSNESGMVVNPGVPPGNFFLFGKTLHIYNNSGDRVRILENIISVYQSHNTIYYIKKIESEMIAGIISSEGKNTREYIIAGRYDNARKLCVIRDIFYFLASEAEATEKLSMNLVRFDPGRGGIQSVQGVLDFSVLDGKTIMLKNRVLDYNGILISLMQKGGQNIAGVIDGRIVLISGGNEMEMVDLIEGKSFYQYRGKAATITGGDNNLILEFSDIKTGGNMIYYNLRIDGVDESRTETGPGEVTKTVALKLGPDRYHTIDAERWELDSARVRYTRSNNIRQPGMLKIYTPVNRVVKIKIEYNGKAYSITQSVMEN